MGMYTKTCNDSIGYYVQLYTLLYFDLNKVADRKRVADDLGSDMFMDKPGYRNFWYMRDSDDEPVRATLKL